MQAGAYPVTRDLVLVGGGHTHALLLHRWGMAPLPGVRLTLISPEVTAPYTGMLPGLVAGHYRPEDLQIDLVRLAWSAGARLVLGRAEAIDRAARRVAVPGRADVAYDLLSLDIGITGDMPDLPGFAAHGVPAKPLGAFALAWEQFVARCVAGDCPAEIAVLGGGVAGVELAMAMAARLRGLQRSARIVVIEAGPAALRGVGQRAAARLLAAMAGAGIALHLSARAVRLEPEAVVLADGRRLAARFVVAAAGARAQGWLADTGLALEAGFVRVGPTLQSETDSAVFAVGDCAHMGHAPRPKAGVFAVRQAPVLFHNLRAGLGGGRLRHYWPQRAYLKLVSTGGQAAVADKFGLQAGGGWLWQMKDRIDRRFMAQFAAVPVPMPPRPVPLRRADGLAEMLAEKSLCGGCGAKVGRVDLMASLAGLPPPRRADVLSGPGDDAAVLVHGAGLQVLTTDHLRAVTDDPWLMTRIAAIHAMGDIWAMGAQPQVALAQVILPPMSPALQARTLEEINAAAATVFAAEAVDVVGGHTSLGAELTIGFTVTGLMPGPPVGKSGALPGDVLVLTKPLGTGVILAAAMAGAAPGAVLAGAWASMTASQGRATEVLAPVARAMTDVTGFGLAGHLGEMLAASGVGARLDLAAVPLLPGAEALADLGVRSSIHAANRAGARVEGMPDTGRAALLFDPQTGGGLLAAVPAAQAAAVLQALRLAGVAAAAIGVVVAGAAVIVVASRTG